MLRRALLIVPLLVASAVCADEKFPSQTSPLNVKISVTPKWREPLQHPTYPPPTTYVSNALVGIAGTNRVFATLRVEIGAGDSKAVEQTVDGTTVSMVARVTADRERAVVTIRGVRDGQVVFENEADFWLEHPLRAK